ncbi:hypothetical protein BDZ91DRAFT_660104 [Kalaharituber pfeilii]|nr:hypothetical protein BDZ91DRAFT_660104 [Kalaharituber pfeilii]
MSGLHTLVDGLTFSPTSPDSSSPVPAQSNSHFITSNAGTFGASHGSIFNNPNSSTTSATPRIQSFGARRISYGSSSSTSNGPTRGSGGSEGGVTKEVDDPSPQGSDRDKLDKDKNKPKNKHITPTKMFLSPASPSARPSRTGSYRGSDTLKLDEFIYNRGFLEGACSDVTIIAFGTRYNLHRLILDRSPFFSSCFNGGPWRESNSSEISITPEQSDSNITQHAFELALARLYGHMDELEEEEHALPLLAAASYLDLQDLAESCVASLLKNLKTSNIAKVLKFVTGSYYGHQTDRLLDSAKAMLYRDGWEMDMTEWDGISGELAAEIIGFDGFYVPDEWLRYCFVKEIIDWRICHTVGVDKDKVGRETAFSVEDTTSEDGMLEEDYEADIKPLKDLLENGIYYMHMSFEELQKIAEDKDVLGRLVVPSEVIREALWNQMLLRQKVLNAPLNSPELGLTEKLVLSDSDSEAKKSKGSNRIVSNIDTPQTSEKSTSPVMVPCVPSRSPAPSLLDEAFGFGRKAPKRFIIPTEDSTIVIGDHMALPDQAPGSLPLLNQPRGARALLHGQELTVAAMSGNGNSSLMMDLGHRDEIRYSYFPPFRFSAEFRAVRALKEKKRVYSKTVFYAGSHWNIYIQKVRSSKNVQLGVYLHRAKDRESALNIAATGYAHGMPGSLQGESMLMGHVDLDGSSSTSRSASRPNGSTMDYDNSDETTLMGHDSMMGSAPHSNTGSVRNSSGLGDATMEIQQTHQGSQVPAISYYTDARPQVQTYFKIFSPSKKGKVLSMFSSGPDSFNFSQSWGWKSSSLILDESLIAEGDKDARLRFMVVLGKFA